MNEIKARYHITTKHNWMNDPIGFIQIDGVYHLYFQYNPNCSRWGDIHWGHISSLDLVHWNVHPIALHPRKRDGEAHCFSGMVVKGTDGKTYMAYTSVGTLDAHQSAAPSQKIIDISCTGMDDLNAGNMITELKQNIHGELLVGEWRDPFIFFNDGIPYCIVGGSIGGRGAILLYRGSSDLREWEYLSIFNLENEISNKTRECPNFFPLGGGKWILFFAPEHMAEYRIGRFEHECFIEEDHGILDYGGWHGFYAPHGTVDEAGRLVLFGWMPETGRPDYSYTEASLCQLSVPRIVGYNPDSGLRVKPAPEVENLFGDLTVPKGLAEIGPDAVDLFESDSFYLKLRISDQNPFRITLSLFVSKNSRTEIVFDSRASIITIMRGISTDDSKVCRTPLNMPLNAVAGVGYEIALYVDRTSVEIFSAEKDCLSGRIFPPRDSLMQVRIESAKTIEIDTLEYAIAKTPESIRYAEAVSNDCAQTIQR